MKFDYDRFLLVLHQFTLVFCLVLHQISFSQLLGWKASCISLELSFLLFPNYWEEKLYLFG